MIIQSGDLVVRNIVNSDKEFLLKWLNDPKVLEFYEGHDNPHNEEMIKKHFLSKQGNPVTGCIVIFKDVVIGYIQFYPISDEEKIEYGYDDDKLIYGMDQFIGEPDYWNQGIGTQLVTAMVQFLIKLGAQKVVMDPQSWNERALRCYEKCGFKKVKLLPQHEMYEGALRDCWLIEYSTEYK